MIEYRAARPIVPLTYALDSRRPARRFSVSGLIYTGSAHQLWEQFRAAVWVILWSALVTFILMKLIGLVLRGARYSDEILEVGDLAIHGEEAFPTETLGERVGAFAMAGEASAARRARWRPRGGTELTGSAPAPPAADWTSSGTTRRQAE